MINRRTFLKTILSLSRTSHGHRPNHRTFLSPAYHCDDAWKQRLDEPLIKNIKLANFYYELNKKYESEGKMSGIDIDLFINRLTKDDISHYLEDIKRVTEILRRSPETKNTLHSTGHSILRLFIDIEHRDMLLKLITVPYKYGIYPDYFITNVILNQFIKGGDYTGGARVAASLMLQEDYGPQLTQCLSLLSCHLWVNTEDNMEWKDYNPPPPEPEDEVKVRVDYLINPFFDDHFDIKDPDLLIGKTLAFMSHLIEGPIGLHSELLGWSMYQKWDNLLLSLKKLNDNENEVAGYVVSKIEDLLSSKSCTAGENTKALINETINNIRTSSLVNEDLQIVPLLETMIQHVVRDTEQSDIDNQIKQYEAWGDCRVEAVSNQLAQYEKMRLLQEVKDKKAYLEAKEETIFFFDREDKLQIILADKAKELEKQDNRPVPLEHKNRLKKSGSTLETEYYPPEIMKKGSK